MINAMVVTYERRANGVHSYSIGSDKKTARIIYDKKLDGVSIAPTIILTIPITQLETLTVPELKVLIDELVIKDEDKDISDNEIIDRTIPTLSTALSAKILAATPKSRTAPDPKRFQALP